MTPRSRSLAVPLALALFAPALAAPLGAQNPLGKAKAKAAHPFAGAFTAPQLRLELAWNDAKNAYAGTLTVEAAPFEVEATERAGGLRGSFRSGGETFEFTLQARGTSFVLRSDGIDHELARDDGAANPPPAAPGPQPGGVGIAFAPKDGKLAIAQLQPGSPAEKARVPIGAVLRAVDGKPVAGLALDAVRDLIRGAVGTLVTLTLETDREVTDVILQRAALPGAPATDQPGAGPTPPVANGALPAWLKPGMRATYFTGSASLPGAGSTLVEDDQGNWVDDQGRRYRQEELNSSGGSGFTQYDFVQATPDCLAVGSTTFAFADAQLATVQRAGTTAFVGDQNGLGDVWVPPAKLRAMREEDSPGHRVRRVRYPLGGRTYDAITTQTRSQGSFVRYTYDLDTGLLLVHSSSTVGKGGMTPNPNGTASMGAGATTIAHGHLRSLRELHLPWLGQQAPQWLQQGQRLRYPGTCRNSLADGVMAPWRYEFTATIDRRIGDAAIATLTTSLDYGIGQPPQQTQSTNAYGPGSVAGLWLDPRSLQGLQPGQVLDRDPITNWQIGFAGSDGQSATIYEQGPLGSQSYTYDLRSGQLIASSVRQQQGPATLSFDVQLAR